MKARPRPRHLDGLRRELREVERDLKIIADPWIKQGLGRKRRELRDAIADIERRIKP